MSTWLQARAVRKTVTKGPNPVWMSARKNVNQSRQRRLARDATGRASAPVDVGVRLGGSFSPRSSQSTGRVVVIVDVDSVIAPASSREGQRRLRYRMRQPQFPFVVIEAPRHLEPKIALGYIRESSNRP
jgi:hypothetical protein